MNEAQQRRFYFPAWNDCVVASGWFMVRGRLEADLQDQLVQAAAWPEPAGPLRTSVITTAQQLAGKEHRAVKPDDLRHACNLIAAGKVSSSALDNKQTNRVVNLFRLFKDPDDLDAVMDWLHPEKAEQSSFVAYLRKQANEAALIAIATNAFGTRAWDELPIEKLRWMCKQMKSRSPRSGSGRRHFAGVGNDDPY